MKLTPTSFFPMKLFWFDFKGSAALIINLTFFTDFQWKYGRFQNKRKLIFSTHRGSLHPDSPSDLQEAAHPEDRTAGM